MVLLYAVMVTMTGNRLSIALPSAPAGRMTSPRRIVPSDIGIATSRSTTVLAYCSPRGFHVGRRRGGAERGRGADQAEREREDGEQANTERQRLIMNAKLVEPVA